MQSGKPIRNPDAAAHDLGGETILYRAEPGPLHILNPTAQFIWELCDGKHTIADIERAIRANFLTPDDYDVMADIRRTLELLAEHELLHITA